jgi:ferredoxin-type protein NapG
MSKVKDPMATRREVLKQVFKGAGYVAVGGLTWGAFIKDAKANPFCLRPPGAIAEEDFVKACIKCGLCIEACPYDTLIPATASDAVAIGTPFFKARDIPCYMCPDIPCVPPCPSGALDLSSLYNEQQKPDIENAKMGLAVINKETCVAFWGIQCDACYRACPLLDEAIVLEKKRNERTGKHAFLLPEVYADICTGCGLCEHACITEVPAIKVFPRKMVMGKAGSHYVKGWDPADEQRIKDAESRRQNYDESSTIDYLNNDQELFNDD